MENRGGGGSILTLVDEQHHQETLSAGSHDDSLNDSIEQHLSLSLGEKKERKVSRTASPTHSSLLDATWTIALCLCTLTHSYLLISVFPYSGYMAIDLLASVNEENAGSYAGWIASSFMLGRAVSSYAWGKAADLFGRRTVLLASLGFSCIFTLLFGTAQTFASAILFRCFLGMSNGITGTAKTIISELAHGNEGVETKSMALVMGMWGWGFLFSPALSGALAEPVRQYPNAAWVQQFHGILSKFPFLLPNIVAAIFCISAMVAVQLYVHETLPREKQKSLKRICNDCTRACTLWRRRDMKSSDSEEVLPMKHVQIEQHVKANDEDDRPTSEIKEARLKHGESCLMLSTTKRPILIGKDKYSQQESASSTEATATMASLWSRPDTRIHLIVYWVFSFVMSCIDESFPLFCISKEAGLGISEASIGKILSGSGIIFAVCQYFVYTAIVNRVGLYGSIKVGSIIVVPLILLIPLSRVFNRGSEEGEISWTTLLYLSVVFAVLRIFGLVFFSSITVTTNRTVPASQRATMNGLSMLGGSATKGLGPVFAGYLVAFSVTSGVIPPQAGGFVIFSVVAFFAIMVAIPSCTLLEAFSYQACPETEQESAHKV